MADNNDTVTAEVGAPTSAVNMTTQPLLMPESFSGKGSFSDWLQHFEGVAAINKWDDAAKLLWLRVRLIGPAQTAYGRIPTTAQASYADLTKALKDKFEPEAMKKMSQNSKPTRKQGLKGGRSLPITLSCSQTKLSHTWRTKLESTWP